MLLDRTKRKKALLFPHLSERKQQGLVAGFNLTCKTILRIMEQKTLQNKHLQKNPLQRTPSQKPFRKTLQKHYKKIKTKKKVFTKNYLQKKLFTKRTVQKELQTKIEKVD